MKKHLLTLVTLSSLLLVACDSSSQSTVYKDNVSTATELVSSDATQSESTNTTNTSIESGATSDATATSKDTSTTTTETSNSTTEVLATQVNDQEIIDNIQNYSELATEKIFASTDVYKDGGYVFIPGGVENGVLTIEVRQNNEDNTVMNLITIYKYHVEDKTLYQVDPATLEETLVQ